ncbi:hypothetical protein GYMLUDRAFT_200411 [Collybiopsis luxurians FD-317 M1]|uniref:Uncharacterized protein n=1 Tax=Collybiopsis luxurians FD-317 M1 TaxID=944289 RepID=A0A0D0B9J1_9AGAR|nr:hypothetical protein GYMLUDRAFT_200411 [Collybiopsis luxurians FD-317 M1]
MALLSLHILAFLGILSYLAVAVQGHVAAWHYAMYCLNGTSGYDNPNNNDPVQPLYQMTKKNWWFHHYNKCDQFPPEQGDFLDLPVNGSFSVELAVNRAFTILSYNGSEIAEFGDGDDHPGMGEGKDAKDCIHAINIHTQNESMAAGTAFAISYQSNMSLVTPENLVVFTVLYHSPWKRIATYSVPNLPACPPEGCICAWGWVPNGCGTPNMYHLGYRCKVTGKLTGDAAVAPAQPPVWCEDDPGGCVKGAKQMLYWNQLEGNNIEVEGWDLAGDPKSPAYNAKCGFKNGAQTDIFLEPGSATPTHVPPSPVRHKLPGLVRIGPPKKRIGPVRVLLELAHRYMAMVYQFPFFGYYYTRT